MKPVDWSKKQWRTKIVRRNIGVAGSRIFLVHGRDFEAAKWMRNSLAQLGMRIIDWDQAISLTGSASPYILDTVRAGMNAANATIILFTADEEVKLRPDLQNAGADESVGYQSRPNVWIEAGMSLALDREKTILVQYGNCRAASDLGGIHFLHYTEGDSNDEFIRILATRLMTAGCKADLSNIAFRNI